MLPINRNPSARDLRSFARLWFPLFVAVAGAMVWWRAGSARVAMAIWAAGAIAALVALLSVRVARAIFVGLMIATYPIGLVVSTLALAILFYLVVTPIGWAMRLAGRDPLRLRARGDRSEWHPFQQDEDPQRIFRQF